jgi:hypothetical protein
VGHRAGLDVSQNTYLSWESSRDCSI